MKAILYKVTTCALLVAAVGAAHASIVITGTRVIYPANAREVTVKLNNNGDEPELMQAWIDDGDINMGAQTKVMPFTLLPPISRIEPGKGQTLRMIYTGAALPQDRESVFFLNVLEIPPKPTTEQAGRKNMLQMAFRTRIKIFFRPKGLVGTADDAPGQVTWQVVPDGKGYAVHADNPSAYSVNIVRCVVKADGKDYQSEGGMVPPKSTALLLVPDLHALPASPQIIYTAVNDYGALHDFAPGGKPVKSASAESQKP